MVPAGGAGVDQFVLATFAWVLLGFANIYYGLARRALDQSVASAKAKGSQHYRARWLTTPRFNMPIAEMVIELESIESHLEKVAEDWSEGVDHCAHR
jgi:alkylation response protein AidB-like acyl-CoA dehydrogenase